METWVILGAFQVALMVKKKKKKPACQCRRHELDPWVRKSPWRREWQPTPKFLPGESRGQRTGRLLFIGSQRVGHN